MLNKNPEKVEYRQDGQRPKQKEWRSSTDAHRMSENECILIYINIIKLQL